MIDELPMLASVADIELALGIVVSSAVPLALPQAGPQPLPSGKSQSALIVMDFLPSASCVIVFEPLTNATVTPELKFTDFVAVNSVPSITNF